MEQQSEIDALVCEMDSLVCYSPHDEYEILQRALEAKETDIDIEYILECAYKRYKRYMRCINLSDFTDIMHAINRFFEYRDFASMRIADMTINRYI
jgi:hypothetical protein